MLGYDYDAVGNLADVNINGLALALLSVGNRGIVGIPDTEVGSAYAFGEDTDQGRALLLFRYPLFSNHFSLLVSGMWFISNSSKIASNPFPSGEAAVIPTITGTLSGKYANRIIV